VGVHPTGGLVPDIDYDAPRAALAMPGAPLASTIGPLARSVRDCAIVTQAMAGPDGRDPLCLAFDPPSYLEHLDDGVDGWRFAWTDDFGFASVYASEDSPRVIAHVRDAAQGLTSIGATVEAATETWEDPHASLHVTSTPYGPSIPGVEKPSVAVLQAAFEARGRADRTFRAVLAEHTLLLSPTSQRVARSVEEWDAAWTTDAGRYPGGNFASTYTADTFMFNWLKYPVVSVPCGLLDGLPVGLQIVGLPGREDLVLRAAQAFQAAFPRDEQPPVS
jgi:Asp-tRNA(Asn)/Glu-tRNA(Gln) amidotransferase A subunit family amidase